MTPRYFVHITDWQFGLRAHFILGDVAVVVRDAHLKTAQRNRHHFDRLQPDFRVDLDDLRRNAVATMI
jgi:hypothetical protein